MPDAMPFADHFSRRADAYRTFRPAYPDRLIARIASLAHSHGLAWDCATGNGQAAIGLAQHFAHVIATDASASQIANAVPHPNIEYHVASADASGLADHGADLVCVAQALHWLDAAAFWREAERVLVPGGLLVVMSYSRPRLDPPLDEPLAHLHDDVLGAWWPDERRLVDSGYAGIALPFPELDVRGDVMERRMSLDAFAGYLRTWSSAQRFLDATGGDAVAPFIEEVRARWGAGDRTVQWPIVVRAAYSPEAAR